jgi:excisionase family DNA binding protein
VSEIAVVTERRKYFTVVTLAEYLDLSERYIRDLVKSKEIPSYTFGRMRRISPEDVDSWLQTRRDRSRA